MSLVMILGVITTLLAEEPKVEFKSYTLRESIVEPFKEFFNRYTAISSEGESDDTISHFIIYTYV